MLLTQLRNGLNSKEELAATINFNADDLKFSDLHKSALLSALAQIESSFGAFDVPRYEPAFGLGGLYYHKSVELQMDYRLYGPLVAMSYGPWQIMYSTAKQVGYQGHPLDLWPSYNSITYVVGYLNLLHSRGAKTVEQVAQGYNSGTFSKKPTDQVKKYIEKIVKAYNEFVLRYTQGEKK